MALSTREGFPAFLSEENGHIPVQDGGRHWLVIVTREAMENVAEPPDASVDRLSQYSSLFLDVATFKLEHGRAGEEDTIWVQSDDITEWQSLQTN